MNASSTEDSKVYVNLKSVLQPSPRKRAMLHVRFLVWRISRRAGGWFKRFLDIVISSTVLFLLSPILLIVALLIKVTDGGPVIYWQYRVGKWGTPFHFPKFRSMVVNAEALQAKLKKASQHGDSITFKIKRDPRITWIGRFIRKTSIDELPQLINVLKGEMSLVGPRPLLVSYLSLYSEEQARRHEVKPGMTGWAQVNGRNAISWDEKFRLDVWYVDNWSIWLDIRILVLTIINVFLRKGINHNATETMPFFTGHPINPKRCSRTS